MTVPPTTLAVRVVVQLPVQTLAPGDSPRALWQTVNVTASERGPGAHAHGGQCRGAIMIQVGRGLNGEPTPRLGTAARDSWVARRGYDGAWFRVTRRRGAEVPVAAAAAANAQRSKIKFRSERRVPPAEPRKARLAALSLSNSRPGPAGPCTGCQPEPECGPCRQP